MSTPEDIEIAKQANAAVIAREGTALTGVSSELAFDEPMVIEGQLPNFVPVAEAEGSITPYADGPAPVATPYADGTADGFTGPADPFNQSWVDHRIRQVTGPNPQELDPYGGPMSLTPDSPEPLSDFGVDAFDPHDIFASIDNPTYAYDSRYDPPDDAPDGPGPSFKSTAKSPYGGGVSKTPYADAAELDDKKRAAKALALYKLTKPVFDALSPEEQEAEINQIIGAQDVLEGVGEGEIQTTEGLAPSAIGADAQTMSAKGARSPQATLAQIAVDQQKLKLQSINQEIVSTDRAVARSRVLEAEAADDTEAKIADSDKAFNELKSAMDSVGDFKVDRDRYWDNKSTGLKIATAISLMLSAYAHAKSGRGGVDPALKMMMQAVENDISDQVKNYNSRVAGVGRKQSLYGLFRQRGLDSQQAEKAATMKAFSELRMDLGRQKLRTNSQMAKLQIEEAEMKLKMAEQGIASGFAPTTFNQWQRAKEHEYKMSSDIQKRTSNVVRGGRRLLARDKTEAARGDKIEATANKGVRAFQDMRNLINKMEVTDLFNPWSQLRQQIKTQRAIMFRTYKDVVSPGTIMSDQDALRVAKIDRDPTDISIGNWTDVKGFTSFSLTALDDFEKSLLSKRDDDLRGIFRNYPTPKRIDKRTIYNTGPVKPRGGR